MKFHRLKFLLQLSQYQKSRTLLSTLKKFFSYHVCVVGSGPSGFYSAKYLIENDKNVKVDIIDKLPTPFGLVRFGVAPDHPEVKSVISDFSKVASNDRINFYGNVHVGKDVTLNTLQQNYSAIILAYGASSDKKLHLPGEDSPGVLSARSFVNWYNGHPDFQYIGDQIDWSSIQTVLVIGQGNVAIDCARIVAKEATDLMNTDITSASLHKLKNSNVSTVSLTGRRGHVQMACTIKEFRELTKLSSVTLHIDSEELSRGDTVASREEIAASRPRSRLVSLINSVAETHTSLSSSSAASDSVARTIHMRFLLSPVRVVCSAEGRAIGVEMEHTELEGPAFHQTARGTGRFTTIPCDLVLKSVGYMSEPIDNVPFDYTSNTIPHRNGRVIDSTGTETERERERERERDHDGSVCNRLVEARTHRYYRDEYPRCQGDSVIASRGHACREAEGDAERSVEWSQTLRYQCSGLDGLPANQ